MEMEFRKNWARVLSALSVVAILHAPAALADSLYDGIWKAEMDARSTGYFIVTITNNQVLLIDLDEVASYQDVGRGTYMGSLPITNGLPILPETPFVVDVKANLIPSATNASIWNINFSAVNLATIFRPPMENESSISLFNLRKIF